MTIEASPLSQKTRLGSIPGRLLQDRGIVMAAPVGDELDKKKKDNDGQKDAAPDLFHFTLPSRKQLTVDRWRLSIEIYSTLPPLHKQQMMPFFRPPVVKSLNRASRSA
jgi:hypothetical protein